MHLPEEAFRQVIIRGSVRRMDTPTADVLTLEVLTRGEATRYPLGAVISVRCSINSRYRVTTEEIGSSGLEEKGEVAIAKTLKLWEERQGECFPNETCAVKILGQQGLVPPTHHQMQKALVAFLCTARRLQESTVCGADFHPEVMRCGLQLLELRTLGFMDKCEKRIEKVNWSRPLFQ